MSNGRSFQFIAAECLKQRDDETANVYSSEREVSASACTRYMPGYSLRKGYFIFRVQWPRPTATVHHLPVTDWLGRRRPILVSALHRTVTHLLTQRLVAWSSGITSVFG